jgi:hypothetical protein
MGWTSKLMHVMAILWLPVAVACDSGPSELVLPSTAEVEEWFGEGTSATFNGNLLEIKGPMEDDHLRRGGRLWARSGPYFFLFNVHIRDLMVNYPDIAAVRVTAVTEAGEEIAVATLLRDDMNEFRWREALARSSLAQRDGTQNPRLVERLITFGEDHTDFRYGELAN